MLNLRCFFIAVLGFHWTRCTGMEKSSKKMKNCWPLGTLSHGCAPCHWHLFQNIIGFWSPETFFFFALACGFSISVSYCSFSLHNLSRIYNLQCWHYLIFFSFFFFCCEGICLIAAFVSLWCLSFLLSVLFTCSLYYYCFLFPNFSL